MYYEYDEDEHVYCRCAITTTVSDSANEPSSDWVIIQDTDDVSWLAPYEEFLKTLE